MKKLLLLTISFASLCFFTGCATAPNGFSQFYQDRAGASITNSPPYSGSTKIFTQSTNPTNDLMEILRSGYGLIGVSAFQGPPQSQDMLKSQARKVGADIVLFSCVYLGSQQTAVPFLQYHPGQSYTTTSSGTVNANTWGSGGYAYGTGNYYGNSTTTSPGTFSTQVVPVTVQRYQYEAGFFRKLQPSILGVLPQPLPPEIRQKLERNTGVIASIVGNDTPAFNANILEGDVILKINDEDVTSVTDLFEKNKKFAGQKVEIELWRNGQFKTNSVQLNNKP
ncbi:MAG: PDZ domain-containing protein [Verrucomicrobiales bacterium]|nr:PDZ domain-containing protein [Verrucomicrobiales bacterium]